MALTRRSLPLRPLPLRTVALPAALAATLVLAACGTGSEDGRDMPGMGGMTASTPATSGTQGAAGTPAAGTPAAGAKTAADIAFATDGIPHHAQAVEMANMALAQATDAKVKAVALKIKAAQGPEITQMTGWLKGWGAPVPATAGGHEMSGMGGKAEGMASAQEMTDLRRATGAAFDRMWLRSMVRHHEGAVAMARTELKMGTNPEARKLAQAIIDGQSAEIAEMKSILDGIPG